MEKESDVEEDEAERRREPNAILDDIGGLSWSFAVAAGTTLLVEVTLDATSHRAWYLISAVIAAEALFFAALSALVIGRQRPFNLAGIVAALVMLSVGAWGVIDRAAGRAEFAVALFVMVVAAVVLFGLNLQRRRDERREEVDRAILLARTGLLDVERFDLRRELGFARDEADVRTIREALSGLAATLGSVDREGSYVTTGEFPFPSSCSKEDLVLAIVHSSGLSQPRAEELMNRLVNVIQRHVGTAARRGMTALEFFPIGLYEQITFERARSSPQSILLARGYPGLSDALRGVKEEHLEAL